MTAEPVAARRRPADGFERAAMRSAEKARGGRQDLGARAVRRDAARRAFVPRQLATLPEEGPTVAGEVPACPHSALPLDGLR